MKQLQIVQIIFVITVIKLLSTLSAEHLANVTWDTATRASAIFKQQYMPLESDNFLIIHAKSKLR